MSEIFEEKRRIFREVFILVKHICFIVPNYPYEEEMKFTFVKQVVEAIADNGIKCTVLAPQSLTNRWIRKSKKRPRYWQDVTLKGNKIDIYQPVYLSISKMRIFGCSISAYIRDRAIIRSYHSISIKPDVLYAHFWDCGVVAGILGKKYDIPVIVATGESKILVSKFYRKKRIYRNLENIKGVICVSRKNFEESCRLELAPREKMTVIPNAVNYELFYPMDKNKVREELGFNQKEFIVAFTGAFIHRKGPLRLSQAVNKLEGVQTIYIGSGKEKPKGEDILFCGSLPHKKVAKYLNAADAFVLPTLEEGCCNAIIEAMACGLPVISSNLPFNNDILDEKNSVRVNPSSITEIANAIQYLKDNPEIRYKMSMASLEKVKTLGIEERAKKIIQFIQESINNNE